MRILSLPINVVSSKSCCGGRKIQKSVDHSRVNLSCQNCQTSPKLLCSTQTCVFHSKPSAQQLFNLDSLAIVNSGNCCFEPNGPLSRLLNNFRNGSRTHGPSAFADGEPQSLLHGYRRDQFDGQGHVVARHHHLRPARQLRHSRHVRGAEVELRTITLEERRMPPAFFLRQHVNFGLELGVRRNRSRLGQHHPALHVFLRRASEQQPGI